MVLRGLGFIDTEAHMCLSETSRSFEAADSAGLPFSLANSWSYVKTPKNFLSPPYPCIQSSFLVDRICHSFNSYLTAIQPPSFFSFPLSSAPAFFFFFWSQGTGLSFSSSFSWRFHGCGNVIHITLHSAETQIYSALNICSFAHQVFFPIQAGSLPVFSSFPFLSLLFFSHSAASKSPSSVLRNSTPTFSIPSKAGEKLEISYKGHACQG